MNFDFKRLLRTETGHIVISIILGLGLATLFRRICTEGDCIHFHGVVLGEVQDKVYKHDEHCYKYIPSTSKCNYEVKRVLDVHDKGMDTMETMETLKGEGVDEGEIHWKTD